MKLVMVISSLRAGGAERQFSNMANYWAEKDWHITLVTIENEVNDFYKLKAGVRRLSLDLPLSANGAFGTIVLNIKRLLTLRKLVKNIQPDCVLSFMDITNVMTILASQGLSMHTVVCERTDPSSNNLIKKLWRVGRFVSYRYADVVVAQTQHASAWLIKHCKANTRVIPNQLQKQPLINAEREPIIVAVGRLSKEKGFDLLLRAFARVYDQYLEWRLVILGEGSERNRLTELCKSLELCGKVELPGLVSNIDAWFARAGMVVQPSRFEGFPNVLLEAMGMGAAVISSDCRSGPSEIIQDGINGRLVPVNNVDDLAQVMEELMADELLRKRLGNAALEVRQLYDQDKIMSMWESVLYVNSNK